MAARRTFVVALAGLGRCVWCGIRYYRYTEQPIYTAACTTTLMKAWPLEREVTRQSFRVHVVAWVVFLAGCEQSRTSVFRSDPSVFVFCNIIRGSRVISLSSVGIILPARAAHPALVPACQRGRCDGRGHTARLRHDRLHAQVLG